jgi:cobalt-zinc-cadmium efflux system membrane fusion protein
MKITYCLLPLWLLSACTAENPGAGGARNMELDAHVEAEARGPNGGRLLNDAGFTVELAIFEAGVPPEFHAWITQDGRPVAPRDVALNVELVRLGGVADRIDFTALSEYLRGNQVVTEPHSFDVRVAAEHAGRQYRWAYESYEGRTTIAADIARASGIATAIAGPGTIEDRFVLYGAISPDITRVREVRARFPGVIRSVSRQIGDTVRAGETLAAIESNESLQSYTVTAPIAGVITARHAEPGEQTSDDNLFEIVDFSRVWAELSVFSRDRPKLRTGAGVRVTADNGAAATGTVDYLAPAGDRASQSVIARVELDNADGRWTPGQFVEGEVTVAATAVAMTVPLSALQRFRDFDVVFARVGEDYEVRMLDLGQRDSEHVEVLGGLAPGTEYVTTNSYLVKADIEKSGASHDH